MVLLKRGVPIPEPEPQEEVAPVPSSVRITPLPIGLPPVAELEQEINEYVAVMSGHQSAPFDTGVTTLMEVSNAYFARLNELRILILQAERAGSIPKNGDYTKIRTGDLNIASDLAKRCTDVGSRRLSYEQLIMESQRRGLDSYSPEEDDE